MSRKGWTPTPAPAICEPMTASYRSGLPLALAACALFGSAASAEPTHAVQPGYWEYTTSTEFSAPSTERRCVRPEEIDKFVSGPSNRHYRCVYPTRELVGGRARFVGTCVSKHGASYPVRWSGTYAPERFDLHGTVSPNVIGLSIPVTATIAARRLSPTCPG